MLSLHHVFMELHKFILIFFLQAELIHKTRFIICSTMLDGAHFYLFVDLLSAPSMTGRSPGIYTARIAPTTWEEHELKDGTAWEAHEILCRGSGFDFVPGRH